MNRKEQYAPICKVDGCDSPARYKSSCLCQKHQYRMRTHGSTDKPQRSVLPLAEKARRAVQAGLAEAIEVGECLEWQGHYACKGCTPVVKIRDAQKGQTRNVSVPRVLWEQENGPIPDGKMVYRSCCNNACVRHLACGTRKDAMRARRKAGTTAHSQVTKLHLTLSARRRANVSNTIEVAREVRQLASANLTTEEIAKVTGVHPAMVAEIRRGRAWRELGASPWQGLSA